MSGWVKIHRKMMNHWVFKNAEYCKSFIYLILKAQYTDEKIIHNGEVVCVRRGELMTSIRDLARDWGWSKDSVSRFLMLLEKDGMITKSSSRKGTKIFINNYSFYQASNDREKKEDETTEPKQSEEKAKNQKNKYDDEKILSDFGKIYDEYPKPTGKTKAYKRYYDWVTKGRVVNKKRIVLTNKQIWYAVKKYKEENPETDLKFIKQFDTFLGDSLLDYIEFKDKG